MLRNTFSPGRPLTKKLQQTTTMVPLHHNDADLDEGYGTSPVAGISSGSSSPSVGPSSIFNFTTPVIQSEQTATDDWSILEMEINRIVCPQGSVAQNPIMATSSAPLVGRVAEPKTALRQHQINFKTTKPNSNNKVSSCQFCAKNGEIRSVVESHVLRHPVTGDVVCPVLSKYVCEMCGATGANAHTKFYCPKNRARKTAPMAILLKTTRNNATGKRNGYF